jgi:hypothetical protein
MVTGFWSSIEEEFFPVKGNGSCEGGEFRPHWERRLK